MCVTIRWQTSDSQLDRESDAGADRRCLAASHSRCARRNPCLQHLRVRIAMVFVVAGPVYAACCPLISTSLNGSGIDYPFFDLPATTVHQPHEGHLEVY